MKTLIFLPYVPYPLRRGTYQRVFNLTRELGKVHEVDLFCLSEEKEDPEQLPVFEAFCNRVHFHPFSHSEWRKYFPDRMLNPLPTTVLHWQSDEAKQALQGFSQGQSYDLIYFCDLVLWPYVRELFPEHPCRIMDRSRVDWLFQT